MKRLVILTTALGIFFVGCTNKNDALVDKGTELVNSCQEEFKVKLKQVYKNDSSGIKNIIEEAVDVCTSRCKQNDWYSDSGKGCNIIHQVTTVSIMSLGTKFKGDE